MQELSILQTLLQEFREKLNSLCDMTPREAVFPDVPNKIKVAIGMRRSGKTYFLFQKILQLLDQGTPFSQILYINFEDDRLYPLDREKLAHLIEAFYSLYPENHQKKCYLFLDEIQNAADWPLVIRRFHDSKNVEIFLTGSSAKLLSKEIATSLRGRSLALEIWPFSFQEFLMAKHISIDPTFFGKETYDRLAQCFQQYLLEGGFPEVTTYEPDVRQQTLQEYIDIVLYRDIIERHEIKHPSLMKYMILSMIHNVSNPFSINKFYNECRNRGFKIAKDILYDYVDYIEDAYLVFPVSFHDKSVRRVQANPKKIYAIDPGIIRSLTLEQDGDFGKLFENVVYLDLRRKRCSIHYYLTEERYEIDFVAQSFEGQKKLFQVVWDINHPETRKREERALEAGMRELRADGEIVTLESYLRNGLTFA